MCKGQQEEIICETGTTPPKDGRMARRRRRSEKKLKLQSFAKFSCEGRKVRRRKFRAKRQKKGTVKNVPATKRSPRVPSS